MNEQKREIIGKSAHNVSQAKIEMIKDLFWSAEMERLGKVVRPGVAPGYSNHMIAYEHWKSIFGLFKNKLTIKEKEKEIEIKKWIKKKCLRKNPEYKD